MNTDNNDVSESWYREREARIQADRDRVGAQKITLENAYSNVEAQWRQLDQQAEEAHDSLDTRAILDIERQRARLSSEATQLQEGYQTLQQQEQQLERARKLEFDTLLESSSQPSQMFLRAYRAKLDQQPHELKRLLHIDQQLRTANVKPDTAEYFEQLESRMGFAPSERSTDDFFESDKPSDRPAKQGQEFALTPEQKAFVKDLNGSVTEAEYAAAMKNPFSQAASTVEVEPANFDTGADKSMEVSLDEPKKPVVDLAKYRKPDRKTSVTLNPAEKELCVNMATTTGRPVNEVLKEFAANKIALRDGKAGHYMLYDAKLRAEGHR